MCTHFGNLIENVFISIRLNKEWKLKKREANACLHIPPEKSFACILCKQPCFVVPWKQMELSFFVIYLVRFKNGCHQRSFFCLLNDGKDTFSTIWLLDVKYPCFSCTEGQCSFIKIFTSFMSIRFSMLEYDFMYCQYD